MNRSFSLLGRNLGLVLVPVIMDIIAFFTGLIILFIGIFLYAYAVTGLQLALMLSLPGLKDESQPPLEAY